MNIRQHTAAIVFLVFLTIGIIGVGLVIGRSRKDNIVSSEVDITNDNSDKNNTGGLRRPPAPEIEDEDSFPSSSIGIGSDATSNSGGRSPLATFVEPTDIPTNSPLPTPLQTKLPTTMLPSGTPTSNNNNGNNMIPYIYPENSMSPPRSQRPPRGYFNYDSSQQSLYGPGYPVIGYDNKNELVVQYANNLWKLYRPPLPIPTSTAIAITNNLDNDNDNTDYQNSPYNYYYWDEFGPNNYGFGPWEDTLTKRNMRGNDNNQCGNVGNQSPIDIRLSGVACVEHHQIRSRAGDFRIGGNDNNIQLQILPSKLRIWVQRRPCRDLNNPVCSEPDPPHADFPNGWGGFSDMLHVDFKFPAEHRINGQTFDGEMQIYHIHPGRKRLPVVSVLIKVYEDDYHDDYDHNEGHNEYLQQVIDAYQYEHDTNMARCANNAIRHRRKNRRRRRLQTRAGGGGGATKTRKDEELATKNITIAYGAKGYNSTSDDTTIEDNTEANRGYAGGEKNVGEGDGDAGYSNIERLANATFGGSWEKLQRYANLSRGTDSNFTTQKEEHRRRLALRWNPYHESLIPTYYFYGYDGGLTEPPCTEIVSWFVMDKPMIISKNQLEQMKYILFTNVNGDTCEETSVHFHNSVARPIQETSNRQVWHCTRNDFVPDHERPT
ncbi:putative carbonic anhydrase [Fragilariopsis cylindrus CCMP1102]|uniref:carbonic anhydrase n=1 Tax=Fragilariopsis cylindrus CCMP1102 TaxID=635003 RepID=A0A1E7ESD8_9STRA|nr:putative carbonic anhydrase [Fragilariopsis cylindrus CCMP1102]|eukprot:OEU08765.1 putative carbonic anhydrase [Fragilariopsis cylindrus CCMP1102]